MEVERPTRPIFFYVELLCYCRRSIRSVIKYVVILYCAPVLYEPALEGIGRNGT